MAKTLKNFDFDSARPRSGAGRPARYPWDEWMDGNIRVLVQGDDFEYGRGETGPTNERARSFLNTIRSEVKNRKPDHKVVSAILSENDEPDFDNGVNIVVKVEEMTEAEIEKREASNRKRMQTRRANEQAQNDGEPAAKPAGKPAAKATTEKAKS